MTRVLVIDDDETLREEVAAHLSFEGFETFEAPNGITGLDIARQHHPDVIVCDLMLPDIDGYTILESLRQDSSTLLIPFIFLSARADESAIRKGMGLGADDYITKPFTFSHLIQAIHARLGRQTSTQLTHVRKFVERLIAHQDQIEQKRSLRYDTEVRPHLVELSNTFIGDQAAYSQITAAIAALDELLADVYHQPQTTLTDRLDVMFRQFTAQTSVLVDYKYSAIPASLPEIARATIIFVAQAALNNVAQHAHVSSVKVALWVENMMLRLLIQDEGCGFDLENVMIEKMPLGLIEIQQRATIAGGEVHIISSPGEGTLINLRIPIKEAALQDANPPAQADRWRTPEQREALHAYDTLTEREREIFHLIVNGLTNAAIAELLTLSIRTVETHRLNLMRKIGVTNKSDLLIYAIKHDLMSVK